MRTLTTVEQNTISAGAYDGNASLEKGRCFIYDLGGAIIGAWVGYSTAVSMGGSVAAQGVSTLVGLAGGTILGQMLNKIVTTTTNNLSV